MQIHYLAAAQSTGANPGHRVVVKPRFCASRRAAVVLPQRALAIRLWILVHLPSVLAVHSQFRVANNDHKIEKIEALRLMSPTQTVI